MDWAPALWLVLLGFHSPLPFLQENKRERTKAGGMSGGNNVSSGQHLPIAIALCRTDGNSINKLLGRLRIEKEIAERKKNMR